MRGGAKNARLENNGQRKLEVWKMQNWKMTENTFANFERNYGVWEMTDNFLGRKRVGKRRLSIYTMRQLQTWYGVCWACHYCQLMISSAHCRISASPLLPTDHTSSAAGGAARPAVTFPGEERHRPSAGTKLYCLVTEAHACEQLA